MIRENSYINWKCIRAGAKVIKCLRARAESANEECFEVLDPQIQKWIPNFVRNPTLIFKCIIYNSSRNAANIRFEWITTKLLKIVAFDIRFIIYNRHPPSPIEQPLEAISTSACTNEQNFAIFRLGHYTKMASESKSKLIRATAENLVTPNSGVWMTRKRNSTQRNFPLMGVCI